MITVPEPRKLKSGNYNIQLRLNDKSYSITEPTAEKCRNRAILVKSQLLYGIGVKTSETGDLTLRTVCNNYCIRRKNVLSPSTLRAYESYTNNRLQDYMDIPVKNINDWQRIINEEADKVSAKTIKNIVGLIGPALSEAGIEIGKITLPKAIKVERPFLDPDEAKIFVAAIKGNPYELQMLLALHGLRRSEILALTEDSITSKEILVRGAKVLTEANKWVVKEENKTASSRRNVPIMIPRIKELDFDVSADPETVRKTINRICRENNLPEVGYHGLRHTYASLCYSLGISEAMCQKLGGWSDVGTMRKIYIHLADRDKNEAVSKLKSFFA